MSNRSATNRRASSLQGSLLILTFLGMHHTANAESLKDAWAMALQSDGGVAAARSDREAADADKTAAIRQRWPALDLNGSYTQFEHAPTLDIATPGGQLQAPIWRHDGYSMAGARSFGSALDIR